MAARGVVDARGIVRGACGKEDCQCTSYNWNDKGDDSSKKCANCGHYPGIHVKFQETESPLKGAVNAPHGHSAVDIGCLEPGLSLTCDHDKQNPTRVKPAKCMSALPLYSPSAPCLYPPSGELANDHDSSDEEHDVSLDHTMYPSWKIKPTSFSPPPHHRGRLQSLSSRKQDTTRPRRTFQKGTFGNQAGPTLDTQLPGKLKSLKLTDGEGFSHSYSRQSIHEAHSVHSVAPDSVYYGDRQAWSTNDSEEDRYDEAPAAIPPDLQCIGCGNMKYTKADGTYYDYCGQRCRDASLNKHQEVPAHLRCIGCGRKKYCKGDGTYFDYCGLTCRNSLQSRTHQTSLSAGINSTVSIKRCNQGESSHLFQTKWAPQKGTCPQVEFVFMISNTSLLQKWQAYREGLGSNINIEKFFHGTSLTCDLARTNTLCTDKSCGACGISRSGFDPSLIGTGVSFQRFGSGFYLAPNSSKCHDYTRGNVINGYRAMLLCEVCPGRKHFCTKTTTSLRAPPQGFDCVYGSTGRDLNYEEIVLYDSRAILPKCVILYKRDGTDRLL